nr:uncharacterized protein LOC113828735 [Penaeus vannamei]
MVGSAGSAEGSHGVGGWGALVGRARTALASALARRSRSADKAEATPPAGTKASSTGILKAERPAPAPAHQRPASPSAARDDQAAMRPQQYEGVPMREYLPPSHHTVGVPVPDIPLSTARRPPAYPHARPPPRRPAAAGARRTPGPPRRRQGAAPRRRPPRPPRGVDRHADAPAGARRLGRRLQQVGGSGDLSAAGERRAYASLDRRSGYGSSERRLAPGSSERLYYDHPQQYPALGSRAPSRAASRSVESVRSDRSAARSDRRAAVGSPRRATTGAAPAPATAPAEPKAEHRPRRRRSSSPPPGGRSRSGSGRRRRQGEPSGSETSPRGGAAPSSPSSAYGSPSGVWTISGRPGLQSAPSPVQPPPPTPRGWRDALAEAVDRRDLAPLRAALPSAEEVVLAMGRSQVKCSASHVVA